MSKSWYEGSGVMRFGYKCYADSSIPPAFAMPDSYMSGACFSPCEQYRYTLWRRFEPGIQIWQMSVFVCLNPSTADEYANDPTVTRCINYAKSWGTKGFIMLNLFAFRATDPRVMKAHDKPESHDFGESHIDFNARVIEHAVRNTATVVLGCGTHGNYRNRLANMQSFAWNNGANKVFCIAKNSDGTPKHPLYLKADLTPQLYTFTPRKKVAK